MWRIKNRSLFLSLAILAGTCLLILLNNFPWGTWLTGWDNLHPEFNFPLNFLRALSSVWQENQGLGTYGGHGYAGTLPHTLLLWALSFALPEQYLRSTFTFLMLFGGAFGLFFLIRELFKNTQEGARNTASLLGSLFYLLNLATVQQFYIQLEAFIVHYATLPWLVYALVRYLDKGTRKRLVIFAVISFFGTVQGFIPPLFFVYLLLLAIFLASYVLLSPSFTKFKRALVILVVTFALNAYWFLPVAYYSVTRGSTYLNSYNNLSSTEDFILKNKKYGDLANVSILKGFIFEAIDSDNNGVIFPIFEPWEKHLHNTTIKFLGFALFGVVVAGLGSLFIRRRNYMSFAVAASFLIIFSLLATNTPPFSEVSKLLQEIPILKQAFRVSFTKFSIVLAFLYAICFACAIRTLLERVKKQWLAIVPILILVVYSWPLFQGNLLYDRTKLDIPQPYFQMFDFFESQNNTERIANFPQGWNWGWTIYKWGYSGSGFLWYGIKQPIMDRAFDVWSKYNENYFWELQYAIYSEKFPLIDNLVDKYQIRWIILDKNILPYNSPKGSIYTEEVEQYLDSSSKYEKVQTLTSHDMPDVRDILVYRVHSDEESSPMPKTDSQLKNIGPLYNFTYIDQAYRDYGNYYTDSSKPFDVFYPFRSLFTARRPEELDFRISSDSDSFSFVAKVPKNLPGEALEVPQEQTGFFAIKTTFEKESERVAATFSKPKDLTTYTSNIDPYFLNHKPSPCSDEKTNENIKQEVVDQKVLRFRSLDSENCYTIGLDKMEHNLGYIVAIESRNIKGKSLQFAVINQDSKKSDIAVSLPKNESSKKDYVFIPPMKTFGIGYNLNFNNISIGSEETVNDLANVEVYPIPYEYLSQIKLVNKDMEINQSIFVVMHQSYDLGWELYAFENSPNILQRALPFLFARRNPNHLIINNWENGWQLDQWQSGATIVIVYLPQYLEFAGFLILLGFGVLLVVWRRRATLPLR